LARHRPVESRARYVPSSDARIVQEYRLAA
jgi:hypothetical protein